MWYPPRYGWQNCPKLSGLGGKDPLQADWHLAGLVWLSSMPGTGVPLVKSCGSAGRLPSMLLLVSQTQSRLACGSSRGKAG